MIDRRTVPIADVPDLAAQVRALGFLTPEDAARLDAVEQARYVLVKMDQGEYWRCGRCGCTHSVPDIGPVLTRFCVPRPWKGLSQGLYAYYQHLSVRASDLSPGQASRLDALSGLPSLADRHPRSARLLKTGAHDADIVGWLIGSVVEISEADAKRYAALINGRAYKPIVRM